MRSYYYEDVEVTRLGVVLGPIDVEQLSNEVGETPNVFSFELESSSGVVLDSVVFTFQVSNDRKVWRTIDGATTTHTGAGITQRVSLPPVRYLRAAITTRGTTANQRGDATFVLANHPYMPT